MHGGFGIALAMGMQAHLFDFGSRWLVISLKDWSFRNPLFIGDTVHTEIEIFGKRITARATDTSSKDAFGW